MTTPMQQYSETMVHKLVASVERLSMQYRIPRSMFTDMKVDIGFDHVCDDMIIGLMIQLAGREVWEQPCSDETTVKDTNTHEDISEWQDVVAPGIWNNIKYQLYNLKIGRAIIQDMFGLVKFDKIEKKRVITTNNNNIIKRTIKHLHVCPLPIDSAPGSYVTFLLWDTPYEGSRDEYLAVKAIADAALKVSPNAMPSLEMMRAVSEYYVAKRKKH